jgi:demethylmenaquinone methyltransferase/2-methoxy-6-polyprenyl-1,4-benzoquinol methylase
MKKDDKFYFGEEEVSKDQKIRLVNDVFDSVSKKYDLMNDILSFGTHRIWKDILINMIISMKSTNRNFSYLDLACGTGDIAYKLLKKKFKKY